MKKLMAGVAAVLLAACGVAETEVVSGADESEVVTEELGTQVPSYVAVRRDMRRCMAPLCGGYWVHDLNRVHLNERYVSDLDFSQVRLSDEDVAAIVGTEGEILLRGKLSAAEPQFKTRKFIVLEAWKGLPGVAPVSGELFWRVSPLDIQCFAAPCATLSARKLNYALTKQGHGVKVDRAALPRVDQEWLAGRIARHDALVAARLVDGQVFQAGKEQLLDASQVYVKMPERIGPCPMFPIARCPEGQVRAMGRTADRCMVPAGCVTPGMCAAYVPSCASGYTLQSWNGGQFACPQYVCDPDFSVAR